MIWKNFQEIVHSVWSAEFPLWNLVHTATYMLCTSCVRCQSLNLLGWGRCRLKLHPTIYSTQQLLDSTCFQYFQILHSCLWVINISFKADFSSDMGQFFQLPHGRKGNLTLTPTPPHSSQSSNYALRRLVNNINLSVLKKICQSWKKNPFSLECSLFAMDFVRLLQQTIK
jgi:hypothetical protein